MGKGYAKRKKQAKLMQEQFGEMQEKMRETVVTGEAGGGMVTISLNGEHEMQKIEIKPDCVDPEEVEALEDLILTAYRNADKKLKEKSSLFGKTGNMPNLPFF